MVGVGAGTTDGSVSVSWKPQVTSFAKEIELLVVIIAGVVMFTSATKVLSFLTPVIVTKPKLASSLSLATTILLSFRLFTVALNAALRLLSLVSTVRYLLSADLKLTAVPSLVMVALNSPALD